MRKSNGMGRGLLVAALVVVGLALAVPANAILYNLDTDHCTGGCGTMPGGTVTLTQNGANVDVTVHLLNGNSYAKTGSVDFQAFKFNAVGVVLGDITVNQTVSGQTLAAQTGSFTGDGTGSFAFGIACTTCGNGGSSAFTNDIIFHVANATIADLTAPNASGFVFVADVLSAQTGNTGPVAATGSTTVPEPTSLLLLGAGLAGIGIWRRKSA